MNADDFRYWCRREHGIWEDALGRLRSHPGEWLDLADLGHAEETLAGIRRARRHNPELIEARVLASDHRGKKAVWRLTEMNGVLM